MDKENTNIITLDFEHKISPKLKDISSLIYYVDNLSKIITLISQKEYKKFDFNEANKSPYGWYKIQQEIKSEHNISVKSISLHSPLEIILNSPLPIVIIVMGITLTHISEVSKNISELILNCKKIEKENLMIEHQEQLQQLQNNLEREEVKKLFIKIIKKIDQNPVHLKEINKNNTNNNFNR